MENMAIIRAKERCSYCMDIGNALELVAITQNASEANDLIVSTSEMHVAVIGVSSKNICEALQGIAGNDLHIEIPKINQYDSLVMELLHAEMDNVTVLTSEKENIPTHIRILSSSPLLENIQFSFYVSGKSFTDFKWKKELLNSDYVFLTISAMQAFTQSEKKFIQTCIKKYVGSTRFATILTDVEYLNSEKAVNDVNETVIWNLTSMEMNSEFYRACDDELHSFVFEHLLANAEDLHQIAVENISINCCEETKILLLKMKQEASEDEKAYTKAYEELKGRADGMRSKGKIVASTAYGDISGALTYNAVQSIHKFFTRLNEEVVSTLETTEDLYKTAELIPDYISTSLDFFKNYLQKLMKNDAESLEERLTQVMTEDANEFLRDDFDLFTDTVPEFAFKKISSIDFNVAENQTRQKVDLISKALLVGSIPVLLVAGFVAAAGTFAASKIVKKAMNDKIILEDKNNAIDAAHTRCSNLEQEMTEEIRQNLKVLAADMEKKVADAYTGFVTAILSLAQEKLTSIELAKSHISQIDEMLQGFEQM